MIPAKVIDSPTLHLIGLRRNYSLTTRAGIPEQWREWHYDDVQNVVGDLVYGVSLHTGQTGRFDYLCALPVRAQSLAPKGQDALTIPASPYAVFVHDGPVAGLAAIFDAVNCGKAELPDGVQIAPGPQLEVYGEGFDPANATGVVEVWIPVKMP